jgi:predicted permease
MRIERWWYSVRLAMRFLFRGESVERELDEELHYHLEQRIENDIARGIPPAEARRAALFALGGIELRKEECRDMRRTHFWEECFRDLRYAVRSLGKSPGFAAVALLSLALGTGANTAIFSLVDKLLLESLYVESPRELVILNPQGPRNGWTDGRMTWSYPAYREIREQQRVFTDMLAERTEQVNLTLDGSTQMATESIVSGNYFEVLGVREQLGRVLGPEDDRRRGGHPVVVLSHGFWLERFGGRPDVMGKSIRLNGHPFTVVGVSEKGFGGLEIGAPVDMFVSAAMLGQVTHYGSSLDARTSYIFQVYGRLKHGVSRDRAVAQLQGLYASQLEQDVAAMGPAAPRDDRWRQGKITLEDGHRGTSSLRSDLETPLVAVMAMTGVVLLIACANLAGLLMARAASRTKEISIRLAIGASRGRIVRQLLVESGMLAVLGGLAGLAVAKWTIYAMVQEMGDRAGRLHLMTNFIDARVLGFALAASVVTGVLFGLLPALTASRAALSRGLKTEPAARRGDPVRIRKLLVTAQVALGLVLVAASGLFLQTLANLRQTDKGFRADRLIQFRLNPRVAGYDRPRSLALFQEILGELRTMPGVSSVTTAVAPVLNNAMIGFGIEVEGDTQSGGGVRGARANAIAPGYFQMMGMPLVRGRDFADSDTAASPLVAIVNETFVNKFLPGQDPIGRRITLRYGGPERYSYEIVGVTRDARLNNMRDKPEQNFFIPYTQLHVLSASYFYVRCSGDAGVLRRPIEEMVRRHNPDIPVVGYRTVDEQIDRLLRPERLVASLSLAFGLLATGLAAVGLYGVTAFGVARRTREIGIRVALGARRVSVMRMVLTDVAGMVAAGIALGTGLWLVLARYVESQLYGVRPRDVDTLAAAAVVLSAVALAAGWGPARRASRVDPIQALRQE